MSTKTKILSVAAVALLASAIVWARGTFDSLSAAEADAAFDVLGRTAVTQHEAAVQICSGPLGSWVVGDTFDAAEPCPSIASSFGVPLGLCPDGTTAFEVVHSHCPQHIPHEFSDFDAAFTNGTNVPLVLAELDGSMEIMFGNRPEGGLGSQGNPLQMRPPNNDWLTAGHGGVDAGGSAGAGGTGGAAGTGGAGGAAGAGGEGGAAGEGGAGGEGGEGGEGGAGGELLEFSITEDSYDGTQELGTITFKNTTPFTFSSYNAWFLVPSGAHCTNDVVPPGASYKFLTGTGTAAHTVSNFCALSWASATPVAPNQSLTFHYRADVQTFTKATFVEAFPTGPGFCRPEADLAFCLRAGTGCGTVTGVDNCGATRTVASCGTCTPPATCGGGVRANVCATPFLVPIADAYVRDGQPAMNFGSETTLQVKNQPGSGNTRRAFLKFDLSGVAFAPGLPGVVKLRLFGNHTMGSTKDAAFAVPDNSWTESGITWNNKPALGAKQDGNVTITTAAKYYEFDVSPFVTTQKGGAVNIVSLAVVPETETTNSPDTFNSREAGSNPPRLVLGLALFPVADAYVREGTPNTNFGAETTLQVKDQPGSGNTRKAFLRFDLAGVTAVGTAKLRLFGRRETGSTQEAAFGVSDNTWTEAGITWNNRPSIGTKQDGNVTITTTARYYEFDVTGFVRAQKAAGSNLVSLAVLPETQTTDSPDTFNSREATSNRPLLVITPP
jgi:hypothetical protein